MKTRAPGRFGRIVVAVGSVVEKYGHPMLRRRHMPFAIGTEERDQWLMCMKQALEETVADERLRNILYAQFVQIGESMRNRGENLSGCCH